MMADASPRWGVVHRSDDVVADAVLLLLSQLSGVSCGHPRLGRQGRWRHWAVDARRLELVARAIFFAEQDV